MAPQGASESPQPTCNLLYIYRLSLSTLFILFNFLIDALIGWLVPALFSTLATATQLERCTLHGYPYQRKTHLCLLSRACAVLAML